MIELTQAEIEMVLAHRQRVACDAAYNQGLHDAYNVMIGRMPDGVARQEVCEVLTSLQRKA